MVGVLKHRMCSLRVSILPIRDQENYEPFVYQNATSGFVTRDPKSRTNRNDNCFDGVTVHLSIFGAKLPSEMPATSPIEKKPCSVGTLERILSSYSPRNPRSFRMQVLAKFSLTIRRLERRAENSANGMNSIGQQETALELQLESTTRSGSRRS